MKYFQTRSLIIAFLIAIVCIGNKASAAQTAIAGIDLPLGMKSYIGDIIVSKPDGSTLTLEKKQKNNFILDGYHIKQSGYYNIQTSDNSYSANIQVEPSDISFSRSNISSAQQVTLPHTPIKISVALVDEYNNPLEKRSVFLVSSRSDDSISSVSGNSNNKGIVQFTFQSNSIGLSTLTAIDTVTGKELKNRLQIVVQSDLTNSQAIGGDDVFFASEEINNPFTGDDSSLNSDINIDNSLVDFQIHGFTINYPNQVEVNSDSAPLTVTAIDEDGNTLPGYTGTIILEVAGDSNAVLPNNGKYTFTTEDQGVKQFDLAIRFTSVGQKTLRIYHSKNGTPDTNIRGEKRITVTEAQIKQESAQTSLSITTPNNGSKIAQQTFALTGKGMPQMEYIVYLDEIEYTRVQTNAQGSFSHSITTTDGNHTLYILEGAGLNRKASESVQITVDTTPPELISYDVSPQNNIQPGSNIQIAITSENNLSKASIRIDGSIYSLSESLLRSDMYKTEITAPETPGTYSVTVEISDSLSNMKSIPQAFSFTVEENLPSISGLNITHTGKQAKITWDALNDAQFTLLHGSNVENLKPVANTTKNTANITLPIGTHFFAVEGTYKQTPLTRSNTISVTIEPEVLKPSAPTEYRISGQANNSSASLTWTAYPQTVQYRVSLSLDGKTYTEHLYTTNTNTVINDLINGKTYTATVTPLDAQKRQLYPPYNPIQLTPQGVMPISNSSNRSIAQTFKPLSNTHVQSGPHLAGLAFTAPFAGLFFYRKRKAKKTTKYGGKLHF